MEQLEKLVGELKLMSRKYYYLVIDSIAFYPAFIGAAFLLLSILMIGFDLSELGQSIKSEVSWLNLKDAATARSIISAIAAGVISITVFSFSMVMIVLNQAASHMSNRVLGKLIGNRFQQVVLGFYIGTIVYAFFLLSTIREVGDQAFPSLSIYLLILLTVFDIFLFIYFLHYVTQSVKYEVIIQRISRNTMSSMEVSCKADQRPDGDAEPTTQPFVIESEKAGVYEGFDSKALIKLCNDHDCVIRLELLPGTYVLQGQPIGHSNKPLVEKAQKGFLRTLVISESESVELNFFYGLRQLMEVAVKALSPGINDPGTAVLSLRSLIELLAYRVCHFPQTSLRNKDQQLRVIVPEMSFDYIFRSTVLPIWDYGKNDRNIQFEMDQLLKQLHQISPDEKEVKALQKEVKETMARMGTRTMDDYTL